MFTGVGKFRSLSDLKLDFTPVEQKYNLKSDARKVALYDDKNGKANDFFTTIDEDSLIRYLLLEEKKYCTEVTKVSESKFKVVVVVSYDGLVGGEMDRRGRERGGVHDRAEEEGRGRERGLHEEGRRLVPVPLEGGVDQEHD